MPRSYYDKTAVGQKHSVLTRPTAGLNSFQYASTISENNLSDVLDAYPDSNEVIKMMQYTQAYGGLFDAESNVEGEVKEAIFFRSNYDYYPACLVVWDTGASKYYVAYADLDFAKSPVVSKTEITAAGSGWTVDTSRTKIFSSCIFALEAKQYACFTCNDAKKLVAFDGTTVTYVTLPFFPKKIVSHANRVFAMDNGNKIWWCRAGDLNTWYGLEQDDDYIVTSTNCKNGSFTIANQPDVPRPLMITLTAVAGSDTYGTVTVVGKGRDGSAQTKVYSPVVGVNIFPDVWSSITSITQASWTAVSTTDTIKVGIAAIGSGYAQDDQGYWTLERETILCDMCVLGNALYIFSPKSIYVFSGYSPDTFSLQLMVVDLGLSDAAETIHKHLAISNNIAYFMSNANIYEFNGNDYPRVISKPVTVNGAVSNNLYGGIPETPNFTGYAIEATMDKVYFYWYALSSGVGHYYVFDIKARSWWKLSGFSASDAKIDANARVMLLTDEKRTNIMAVVSNITEGTWDIYFDYLGTRNSTSYSQITTKAFSSSPSEDGTLTNVVLTLRGTVDKEYSINLYYSNGESGDFTLVEEQAIIATGTLERVVFNLPVSLVSRVLAYRLKVEVVLPYASGYAYSPMYLYNLERVHRIMGRSR